MDICIRYRGLGSLDAAENCRSESSHTPRATTAVATCSGLSYSPNFDVRRANKLKKAVRPGSRWVQGPHERCRRGEVMTERARHKAREPVEAR